MKFDPPLISCRLVKRYKRFLADVEMADGSVITAHCPNPGAMLGLNVSGAKAWISDSQNPKRKLRYTLELLEIDGVLVGVNTNLPNKLAVEAIRAGRIPSLNPSDTLRTEVKYGVNSRIDILLTSEQGQKTYVEVKNVHLVRQTGLHEFPDCVTARGAKHLDELVAQAASGDRAVMLFVVQREDGDQFAIAEDLDPNYAAAFKNALENGVEALTIRCKVTTDGIDAVDMIPIKEVGRHE